MAVSNESTRRSALVAGATSGIGRAIAEGLVRRGASVVLHGRDSSRGDAVVCRAGIYEFVSTVHADAASFDRQVAVKCGPVSTASSLDARNGAPTERIDHPDRVGLGANPGCGRCGLRHLEGRHRGPRSLLGV